MAGNQQMLQALGIRTQLRLGQPSDSDEQEADAVADFVMQVPEPHGAVVANRTPQGAQAATASENLLPGLGSGQQLDETTRSHFEPRLGADLSHVRVHTGQAAAASAESIQARAYTLGSNVVFAAGEFAPQTEGGRRLLAHELAHTLQQSANESSKSSMHALPAVKPAESHADLCSPSIAGHAPRISRVSAPRIARQPRPSAPRASTAQTGADLDSDDPIQRGATLQRLAREDDEASWRAVLLAQESRHADVRTEAAAIIRSRLDTTPAFETYLRDLASTPRGALSDLAIRALAAEGAGATVDIENYSNVIAQRLALARAYLLELDDQLFALVSVIGGGNYPRTGPTATPIIDELEGYVYTLPIESLWEVGLRASTLLEQLSQIRVAADQLQGLSGQISESGALRRLVNHQLLRLLLNARYLTGVEDDPAFARVMEALAGWPGVLASALVDEMHRQFTEARDQLTSAIESRPLRSFRSAFERFREERMLPLRTDLETLIAELELLRPVASDNPDMAFAQLQGLEYHIRSIGERILYTLQAENMMNLYAHLTLTGDSAADLLQQTKDHLKHLFAFFAQLEVERDRDPEATQRAYEEMLQSEEFAAVMRDIEDWNEILEGELAFARFLLDVLIVIASLYTGGLAAGIVRGIFGSALSLGGRVAIGTLAFTAEVTAFTLTSRGLRWTLYDESFTEGLGGELVHNALLFGLLRGSGAVYRRFGAPRLPTALRPAGAMTTTFAAFQSWSVGLTAWQTGEWIGPADRRFWQLAAHNALFLGAIHLGINISRPLVAPVESGLLRFQVAQHNRRCQALEAQMRAWESAERPDFNQAVSLVRRAQTLYMERLEVLRSIHRNSPTELTAEEFQQAEEVLRAQVQAAENTLFQSRFNMTAHETIPNTFYYEGRTEHFRAHYEQQGYEFLEADLNTGRMRLRTPEGDIIDLIRTRLEPTGAGRRTPGQIPAEAQYERIRSATTDISTIAENTGIPARVIRQVKNHLFVRVHRIPVGPGEVQTQRFEPDPHIARLWTAATEGQLSEAELAAFRRLLAHEYVESALMRRGMPYHSEHPSVWQREAPGEYVYWPTAEHFGAHDLAPLAAPERPAFEHWRSLFGMPVTGQQARRLRIPIEEWMDIRLEEAPESRSRPSGAEAERAAITESTEYWSSRATQTNFARHQQTFNSLAATLRNTAEALRQSGQEALLPRVDESVLRMPVDEFIRRTPHLDHLWRQMTREARWNPDLRQQMNEFLSGRLGAGSREVGSRRPDIVEFFLDRGEVVVTDVTTQTSRVHAFKTEFYRSVVEAMIGGAGGPQVYGLDINVATDLPTSIVTP